MRRVIIILDVTEAEAQILGDVIAENGPEFEGCTVKDAVEAASAAFPNAAGVTATIRSRASAALGGPDTP